MSNGFQEIPELFITTKLLRLIRTAQPRFSIERFTPFDRPF
jgi:hypothetical protein